MEKIYCLYHQYTYGDDSRKGIGLYTSYEKALNTKKLLEKQPGFIDYPDCFYIQVIELDGWNCNLPEQIKRYILDE